MNKKLKILLITLGLTMSFYGCSTTTSEVVSEETKAEAEAAEAEAVEAEVEAKAVEAEVEAKAEEAVEAEAVEAVEAEAVEAVEAEAVEAEAVEAEAVEAVAEEAKAEEVKAEEVKAEEVKAEEVKAEEVKVEEVKAEEPKGLTGRFSAEGNSYDDYGWKPALSLTFENGTITNVSYDEVNADGVKKSGDTGYLSYFNQQTGVKLDEVYTTLSKELLAVQAPESVDSVSGATIASDNFVKLAKKIIADNQ